MTEGDIDIVRRVVESSPAIVLMCFVAIFALWKRLDKKDDTIIKLHRETLTALSAVTTAVDELKSAIESRK